MQIGKALRKGVVVILGVGVLAGLLAYLSSAFREKVEPGKVPASGRRLSSDMKTWTVHRVVDVERIGVPGTLRAERRTEVSPRIMATITEMNVSAGEDVEKGFVLARLDDRDLRASLQQARQQVASAEASYEDAQLHYQRAKELYENGAGSKSELDGAEAAWRVAQAQLSQARDAVDGAEAMLSYSVIKAPTSGVVVDKLADVGDTASPGKPLLAIYDPTALRLEAAVPESVAAGVQRGAEMEVRIDSADTTGTLPGVVEAIVPRAEVASRSMLVKVRIPFVEGLVEGMFGRLFVPTRERVRLCLAESAVREVGQLRQVEVVLPGGDLERRHVKLGAHRRYGRVEVLSGLEAGEEVVLYGERPPDVPDALLFGGAMEGGAL